MSLRLRNFIHFIQQVISFRCSITAFTQLVKILELLLVHIRELRPMNLLLGGPQRLLFTFKLFTRVTSHQSWKKILFFSFCMFSCRKWLLVTPYLDAIQVILSSGRHSHFTIKTQRMSCVCYSHFPHNDFTREGR